MQIPAETEDQRKARVAYEAAHYGRGSLPAEEQSRGNKPAGDGVDVAGMTGKLDQKLRPQPPQVPLDRPNYLGGAPPVDPLKPGQQ
jgi:hypothetical protein